MTFSARSEFDLRPNRLARTLERLREQRVEVLDLTLSNPTLADLPSDPAHELLAGTRAASYAPEPFGLSSARAGVADFMREQRAPIAAEHVILTASTSEAYGYLFKLLCDPGDEVIAPRPSYPLLEQLAQLEHARIRTCDLVLTDRFSVDVSGLRAAVSDRTRAVFAVHPNNPTGSYLRATEIEAMLATDLPLVSDEVFAPYPLEETAPVPSARVLCDTRGLVISLHGLSKLGLPQMKLSWMCVAGDPALVSRALERLELIADAFLSVATPIQLALPAILASRGPVLDGLRTRLRENLGLVRAELEGSPLTALPVEGGFNIVVRLPSVLSDDAWAIELLERAHTLVQPGYFYDFTHGPFVVLSLLPRPGRMREGIRRIRQAVESAL